MQIAVGAIIAGKYELERPLARGGMGSVWVARHVKLGSRLAVKFLDPRFASAPAFIDRFEREARAAAALHNPHVVHVQDYGVEETTPYLVMELLQGEDLETRLRRVGRLSLQEAAKLLVQVGKALRKAHEAGIVHRDLKPANLFLSRVDDEEEVLKVLDFGIAKETGSAVGHETKTGEVMGSPHYMCPEQARADKGIDPRADLWAVGVILYRMVTGSLPFTGEVLGAILSRILVDPVPPVASVAPDLPVSLDFFFAKAMAKSKEQRFQSIRELVDAFLQIAGGGRASLGSQVSLGSSDPSIQMGPVFASSASSSPATPIGVPVGQTIPLPATAVLPPSTPGPAGGAGPGTLTSASVTRERAPVPAPASRRSAAPWIAAGGLLLLLVIGGGYGLTTERPGGAGSDVEPGTASPSARPGSSNPPDQPILPEPGPTGSPGPTTTPQGSGALTGSTAPTTAPEASGAPTGTATAPATSTAAPTGSGQKTVPSGSRPAPTPQNQKPRSEWGF